MQKFNYLNLEKGMYSKTGESFSQILERLDPSEQYLGTSLEGLDAYQRQLKRFDIRVKGTESSMVEKFFQTSQSAVLFPEYVIRAVRAGINEVSIFSHIVASETKISGTDYPTVALDSKADGTTSLCPCSNLVRLHKRGRMLVASYEAIRYQKLDLFSVILRQIGAQIEMSHLEDAIEVIVKGDGNSNAAQINTVSDRNKLSCEDLLRFWSSFEPYQPNVMLMNADIMAKMLSIDQLRNAFKLNTAGNGELIFPTIWTKILRSTVIPDGKIVGLDKNYALEKVTSGDVMVEYDKLIDRKFERSSITTISGYAKIFEDASRILAVR